MLVAHHSASYFSVVLFELVSISFCSINLVLHRQRQTVQWFFHSFCHRLNTEIHNFFNLSYNMFFKFNITAFAIV